MEYQISHTTERSVIVDKETDMSNPEVYELMKKYNLNKSSVLPQAPIVNNPNQNLTFDEMVKLEENRLKFEKQREDAKRAKDKELRDLRALCDGEIGHYERKYTQIDGTNFGFEIISIGNIPINY
jgi:hypothetical protein